MCSNPTPGAVLLPLIVVFSGDILCHIFLVLKFSVEVAV